MSAPFGFGLTDALPYDSNEATKLSFVKEFAGMFESGEFIEVTTDFTLDSNDLDQHKSYVVTCGKAAKINRINNDPKTLRNWSKGSSQMSYDDWDYLGADILVPDHLIPMLKENTSDKTIISYTEGINSIRTLSEENPEHEEFYSYLIEIFELGNKERFFLSISN